MKLISAEANSALWKRIKDHMQERLDEYRVKNDKSLDPIQTAYLRGQISTLKNLMELDQPEPSNVAENGPE